MIQTFLWKQIPLNIYQKGRWDWKSQILLIVSSFCLTTSKDSKMSCIHGLPSIFYLLLYWILWTSTSQAPKKFIKRIQNSQSSQWNWPISPKSCWLAIFRDTQKFNNNVFLIVDVPPAWETLIFFITLFFCSGTSSPGHIYFLPFSYLISIVF